MKSFTTLRNLYGTLTKNTGTSNLTLGDQLINDEHRALCAKRDFYFLHRLRTATTLASTQFVNLPYDVGRVESVYVTVGTTRYTPKLITSREQWDLLNQTPYTSDFPKYAFVFNGQIGLWPTPATAGSVISLNSKIRLVDLSIADITSTTITTLANGSTALTVSGGLTTQMAGFWIRPTFTTTANTGDGEWYELSSVTSATVATLVRAYGGSSIAVGTAASTIGQMPLLPEDYHNMLVWKPAAQYWYTEGDKERGDSFMQQYNDSLLTLVTQDTAPVTDPVADDGGERVIINPNLTVQL